MPELHVYAPACKLAIHNCNKMTSVRTGVKYSNFQPQHSQSDSRHDEQDIPAQSSVRGERHDVGMGNTSDGHGHDG